MTRVFLAVALFSGILFAGMAAAELQNVCVNGHYSTPKEDRYSEVVETYSQDADGEPAIILDSVHAQTWRHTIAIPARAKSCRSLFTFYTLAQGASQENPVAVTVAAGNFPAFRCVLTESGWQPWLMDVSCGAGEELEMQVTASFPANGPHGVVLGLPRLVQCYGPYYAGFGGLCIFRERPANAQVQSEPLDLLPNRLPGYAGSATQLFPKPWPPVISGRAPGQMPTVQNSPPCDVTRRDSAEQLPDQPLVLMRFHVLEPATVHLMSPPYVTVAALEEGYYWLPVAAQIDDGLFGYFKWAEGGFVEQGPVDIVPNFMIDDQPILDALSQQFSE